MSVQLIIISVIILLNVFKVKFFFIIIIIYTNII